MCGSVILRPESVSQSHGLHSATLSRCNSASSSVIWRMDDWSSYSRQNCTPDVGGVRAIAILRETTLFVLANAHPPNRPAHLALQLRPRAARLEAFAARLRRVLLRRARNREALRQLVHKAHADARWIAAVYRLTGPTGDGTPAAVGEHERARVIGLVHRSQASVEPRL